VPRGAAPPVGSADPPSRCPGCDQLSGPGAAAAADGARRRHDARSCRGRSARRTAVSAGCRHRRRRRSDRRPRGTRESLTWPNSTPAPGSRSERICRRSAGLPCSRHSCSCRRPTGAGSPVRSSDGWEREGEHPVGVGHAPSRGHSRPVRSRTRTARPGSRLLAQIARSGPAGPPPPGPAPGAPRGGVEVVDGRGRASTPHPSEWGGRR
jgi:hypothetical protein